MKILVFGSTGQVATELQRQGDVTALPRSAADLADPAACTAAIRAHGPDAVINAAAYTAVDRAESEPDLANTVNAAAPAAMAAACADLEIAFCHVSTDYVFDGSGSRPWAPGDPTNPLNVYGRTKRAGERAVLAAGGQTAILRTSWVFSAHGQNFVKTMLRLSTTRNALNIVGDQIGGPTPAADIAHTLLTMAGALKDGHPGGVWHCSGQPATSWACFARETFARAGRRVTVSDIPTSAYPTPAKRPLNSRLDCRALADFGLAPPDWRAGLADVLTELGAST